MQSNETAARIVQLENQLRDYRVSLLATQGAQSRLAFLTMEVERISAELERLPELKKELAEVLPRVSQYQDFHAKTYGFSRLVNGVYEPERISNIKAEIRSLKHPPSARKASGAGSMGRKGGGQRKHESIER